MNAQLIPNAAATLIDTLIAGNRGDRAAFEYNGKRYSYQDVAALMNRAAALLKGLGVEARAAVLLLVPPSPALVAGLLGAIKAGAVPVVGVPTGGAALERCVAAVHPAAAIVHEDRLVEAAPALAGIPKDAVIVVGGSTHGYKSFIDELRRQPSWLAAQDVSRDTPALGFWTGSRFEQVSHAELAAFARGEGPLRAGKGDAAEAAAIDALLRAFSKGDEAMLAALVS